MSTTFFLSALTLGFLGSFHCIGMCGAIALSLPVQHYNGWKKYAGIAIYNLGRVSTYSLLGAVLGTLGNVFNFWGWQQTISIFLGCLLILYGLLTLLRYKKINVSFLPRKWNNLIIHWIAPYFQSTKLNHTYLIGLLNGLLPCGLVYMAIAGAVATHHSLDGALYMAVFGLGTLPTMLLVGISGNFINLSIRNFIKKCTPIIIGSMGALLIIRGANLNIPYISPTLENEKVSCCHR